MNNPVLLPNRRRFLAGAATAAGLFGMNLATPAVAQSTPAQSPAAAAPPPPPPKRDPMPEDLLIIGPRPGYTPGIGTMVSMLTYVSQQVFATVKGLTMPQLDYLLDPKANTVGALLMHLAATEVYYGMNTFENKKWDSWPDDVKKKWDAGMNLDDAGRKEIKGHELDYYLNTLTEVREHTLAEFKKRDDAWLQSFETEQFGKMKVNIHWKWFHVCEHESHHAGQMAIIAKRSPGFKSGSEG